MFDSDYDSSPLTFDMRNRLYSKKHKSEIFNVTKERMHIAIKEINENSEAFKNVLRCPRCGTLYSEANVHGLDTFVCNNMECAFVLDGSRTKEILLYNNKKGKIDNPEAYYGMDYVSLECDF